MSGDITQRLHAAGCDDVSAQEVTALCRYWDELTRLRESLDRSALGGSDPAITYRSWRPEDE